MGIFCLTFFLSSFTHQLNTDVPTSHYITDSAMESDSGGPWDVNDQ